MNWDFKIFTALIFLCLPSLIHAETRKCENFNTHEFFQPENDDSLRLLDEELFFQCLEVNNGSLIWAKDDNGSIPMFKALISEIDPIYIDRFFFSVDDWDKLLDQRDNQGRNAMTVALQDAPYWEQMLRLISFGGDIKQKQTDDLPEFIDLAAEIEGNEDFVALLLALGADSFLEKNDLKGPNNTNMRALILNKDWSNSVTSEVFDACEFIDQKEVLETLSGSQIKFCLKNFSDKLNISYRDRQGNSLLHIIAKYGTSPDLVDAIFEIATEDQKEIFLKQTNEDGYTALDIAAKYSLEPNIITRLLAWGMETKHTSGIWNPFKKDFITQPFHLAASRTDGLAGVTMLRLLAAGADVFAQDENGDTALHIYIKNKEVWVPHVGLILEVQKWQTSIFKRKTIELKNKVKQTALGLATLKLDEFWVIEEMLDYGADPDHVDQEGWTPLLIYTQRGTEIDIFRSLLESSEDACDIQVSKGQAKGVTVIMLLKKNKILYESDSYDGASPMALLKEKCPV